MRDKEKKYLAAKGENAGFLNADDDFFAISENAWVNMEGFRTGSTDRGVTGTLETVGGNVLKSAADPNYLEIGKIEDVTGNRIIYFKYHTTGSNHKIMVYDKTLDTDFLALTASQVTGGFNWSKYYLIHGLVINGVAYWTENMNELGKLNIDAAIKMNNVGYVTTTEPYTNPIEADVLTVIRKPPEFSLAVTKTTLGTPVINYVKDFAGFFAWRFTFRDNEISVLSPWSKLINYNTTGETYDSVLLVAVDTTGTPHDISQDVQTVDFCVKGAQENAFNIIKTWDKRIAADAAAIAAHNTGVTPLSYTFLNDRNGIALDSAYSFKPYDSVPRKSKTLSAALNRLMPGHNLESFNTPNLSSLTAVLVSETNHTPYQNPSFKSMGTYQVGIIFRDKYKRIIGNVVTNDSLRLTVPARDYNDTTYYYYIATTLSNAAAVNEIPIEAYYYELVITKNLKTRFFMQAKSGGMKYAIKNPATNEITYQDTYISSAYGLAFNLSLLNAEGMGYQYQENDIIQVIQSASATQYSLAVLTTDAGYVISKLQDLGSFATQPDIIFEIYSPYKELSLEPFFTVGDTYAITNPGLPGRVYSSLGGTIYGDVYRFGRFAPSGSYFAENMSPIAKYWKEWNVNRGEANFILRSIEVTKYTAARWSNVIIQGSQTNGLSSFDALDEKVLPDDLGKLSKLQNTSKVEEQGNVMLAIGENETASLYLGEVQLVGASQNAYVASAPGVIGTVNVLKGSFGTRHPETVIEYRGNVYWWDDKNGRIVQYSANGLFPISNYKMTRFWKNWSEQFLGMTVGEIEALGGRPFVFTTVDPYHDELLFSIPRLSNDPPKGYVNDYRIEPVTPDLQVKMVYPYDIMDYREKVLVYDLKESAWKGAYPFYTEGFAVIQNQLYAFKDGLLYLHNQPNQLEFFGEQKSAKIMVVSNKGNLSKIYNAMAVESNVPPTYVNIYNEYPYLQESDLVDDDFTDFGDMQFGLEGIWNRSFYRNITQPTNTIPTHTSRLTGEKMQGVTMLFMLQFDVSGTTPVELKFINFAFSVSHGNPNV